MSAPTAATIAASVVRLLDAVVLLAAVGLLAATLAALGARAWWAFELFTHFRLHYALAALPLGVALAALGRRRFAAVLVLAAVPNVWPLLPYLPGFSGGEAGSPDGRAIVAGTQAIAVDDPAVGAAGTQAIAADDPAAGAGTQAIAPDTPAAADARAVSAGAASIELMAVNVEWRNAESDRLLEMIRAESPDAVLVVELTESWLERLEPVFAAYPHRVVLPDARAFGIALLSRLPLRDVRPFRLESTYAIDARIAAPAGELRLIGVHLRPPMSRVGAAERARQLQALARLAEGIEGPLAIAGDFNLTPYSPYFSDLLRNAGLRDARASSGPGFTWPSFLPVLGIPIDHCIVSPELAVAAFRRLPAFGSDHYPIVVELIMEGEQ